ncbi:MAG: hypothetical protein JXR91_06105 [Deltaproteobacteria bacterium]|nr:hypothetical protein [Deltaproteobacteria bacterium]
MDAFYKPVYCEKCGKLALAKLNDTLFCSTCLISFISQTDNWDKSDINLQPLQEDSNLHMIYQETQI